MLPPLGEEVDRPIFHYDGKYKITHQGEINMGRWRTCGEVRLVQMLIKFAVSQTVHEHTHTHIIWGNRGLQICDGTGKGKHFKDLSRLVPPLPFFQGATKKVEDWLNTAGERTGLKLFFRDHTGLTACGGMFSQSTCFVMHFILKAALKMLYVLCNVM